MNPEEKKQEPKTPSQDGSFSQAGPEGVTAATINEQNRKYWKQAGGSFRNGEPNPDADKA